MAGFSGSEGEESEMVVNTVGFRKDSHIANERYQTVLVVQALVKG